MVRCFHSPTLVQAHVISVILSAVLVGLFALHFHPNALSAREALYVDLPFPHTITIPTSGRFRAIIVFIRFRDDTMVWDEATPATQAWSQPDVLPPFAQNLLSTTPIPPFHEASLTDYFYQQSQSRLTLYGNVYPSVVVTAKNEEEYADVWNTFLNIGALTKETLNALNADPAFDLGAYDANNDGYIDHVFFVLRKLNHLKLVSDASGCAFTGYGSGRPEFGQDPDALKMAHGQYSGSYLRYSNAGNIFPEVNLVRLMAHEFGHDLWESSPLQRKHTEPIGGAFGVPENGTNRVGYVLMAGAGAGRDTRGDETISAFERDILDDGWITCRTLDAEGTYRLTDLYSDSTANCYKLKIPGSSPVSAPRTVYLSNRQRVGFFDRLRTNTCTTPPNNHGLKSTGLLVTVALSNRIAVVAADNTLDLSIESRAYNGDMYSPETAVQLTPWTRPNIAGYTTYPDELGLPDGHFQAIDNIRYTGEPRGVMAFDYIADFRRQPVIREDSWIGPETAGYTFTGVVVVTNRRTLTINTTLSVTGIFRIEEGSTVVVDALGNIRFDASSTLYMAKDARLIVRGQAIFDGVIRQDSGAEIEYEVDGSIHSGITSEEISQPLVVEAPYPNPFHSQTVLAYELPETGLVRIRVYDALGRAVATPIDERQPAGRHRVVFDASRLTSGVYLYRFEFGRLHRTHPMVVLR